MSSRPWSASDFTGSMKTVPWRQSAKGKYRAEKASPALIDRPFKL